MHWGSGSFGSWSWGGGFLGRIVDGLLSRAARIVLKARLPVFLLGKKTRSFVSLPRPFAPLKKRMTSYGLVYVTRAARLSPRVLHVFTRSV